MNDAIQTQLLGARIEMKERSAGSGAAWYSDFDSDRGALVGTVRLVAAVGGQIVLHVEDDEGWIHSRSTTSHIYRVLSYNTPSTIDALDSLKRRILPFKLVDVGESFRFTRPPPGFATCKLVKVEKTPGWAMPEGWGFVLADDPEVQAFMCEVLDERAPPTETIVPVENPDVCGLCEGLSIECPLCNGTGKPPG